MARVAAIGHQDFEVIRETGYFYVDKTKFIKEWWENGDSKESVFSDLNNLEVVTTTLDKYEDCFGFTEEEVFDALDEFGLGGQKQQVKDWYDGFTFGKQSDIYNPWSIINFLGKREVGTYWANTSSNSLIGKLVREGSPDLKMTMERLLRGESFETSFDEQIVFSQLDQEDEAVWSLLLASGYLKVMRYEFDVMSQKAAYSLRLTNLEVRVMFRQIIANWFDRCRRVNNAFLEAIDGGRCESDEHLYEQSCPADIQLF